MPQISPWTCLIILITLTGLNPAHASLASTAAQNCGFALDHEDVANHLATNGLIQFRVKGVAQFQGRVASRDKRAIRLQGQFGSPRRILLEDIKDLRLLRNDRGEAVTEFAPLTGSEISTALRAGKRTRGSFEDAVMFALEAHGPQIYNDVHYGAHLDAVVAVLTRFGIKDSLSRIAAVLHDVIEDAHVTFDEVSERFGRPVADAVRAVSLPAGLPRDEAFELLYPAIRNTPGALWVKLADRIANVEDARRVAATGKSKNFLKYVREWDHFKASLSAGADPTALRMFEHLDRLFAAPVR